jgi:hypothetical protein
MNDYLCEGDNSEEKEFEAEKLSTFQKVRVQVPGKAVARPSCFWDPCLPQIETMGLFFGALSQRCIGIFV